MTRHDALVWLTQQLCTDSLEESRAVAFPILCWITSTRAAEFLARGNTELSPTEESQLKKVVHEHLSEHKPLQYIIGSVPFLSATITVRPPVLIPRPETEYWCAFIIQKLTELNQPNLVLLDMCTGSGCVAIALAQAFPKGEIYASDISPAALALAQENALKNGCSSLKIIQSDLFEQLPTQVKFDCIVSNPPYVTQADWHTLEPVITQWEDPNALVAQQEGLAIIQCIIKEAPHWLKRGKRLRGVPHLLIEHGNTQGEQVQKLMQEAGFISEIHTDLAGKERFTTGELHPEE
jgi:release factor glutamine methyltransferase